MSYWPRSSIIFLVCITSYWLAASIFVLEERDLWLDEGFTFLFVNSDRTVFWKLVFGNEMNMLPYYMAVRPFALLGLDAFELRYLSLVPAFLTILLFYRFSVSFFSQRVAILATYFLATNSLFIRYSGELRGYSLTMLLVLGAVVLLYLFLSTRRPAYLYWLAFIAILAFYSGFLSILAFGFIGVILLADSATKKWAHLKHLIFAFIISAVGIAPGFYVILTSGGQNLAWVSPTSVKLAYQILYQLLGTVYIKSAWAERVLALGFIIIALMITYSWAQWVIHKGYTGLSPSRREIFLSNDMPMLARGLAILIVSSGAFMAAFAISFFQPMMVLRYFTMIIPFFMLVLALGLLSLPYRSLQISVIAAFSLLFAANSLSVLYTNDLKNPIDEEWPKVIEILASNNCQEKTNVVIYSPKEQVRFNPLIPEIMRTDGKLACLENLTPRWFHIDTGGLVEGVDVHKHIGRANSVHWPDVFHQERDIWIIAVRRRHEQHAEMLDAIFKHAGENNYVIHEKYELKNTTMIFLESKEKRTDLSQRIDSLH